MTGPLGRLHARAVARATGSAVESPLAEGEAFAILARIAAGLARGAWLRLFCHESRGPVLVGRRVHVTSARCLTLGSGVKLEDLAEIQCRSHRGIALGDGVTIGRGASVRPSSYYGHDMGEGLSVGAGTAIGALSWIGASGFVEIGTNVLIGPRVTILPENHLFEDTSVPIKKQGVAREGIVIEDDCWIGAGATLLAGVRVGRGSIVAAGAVVNRSVAPGSIVGGVPARVIGTRDGKASRGTPVLLDPHKRQAA